MPAQIITWQPDSPSLGEATVAIGVFDGVHLGHQALLADTAAEAAARDVQSVALTFDRDPDQVVSPSTAAPQLLTLDEKLHAMSLTAVGTILVVPFTVKIAALDPDDFLDHVLLSALTPRAIHVGRDFQFGRGAAGDVTALERWGQQHDLLVVAHDLVTIGGEPVTSTRVRNLIAAGQIDEAASLLGKHPTVSGLVHRGRGEGFSIGFPSANVVPTHFAAMPADGVYAGRAHLPDGTDWPAAISVGRPPTYPDATDCLEAHLIGYSGDLYDQRIALSFWARLRELKTFASAEELAAAIGHDVEQTREITGTKASK